MTNLIGNAKNVKNFQYLSFAILYQRQKGNYHFDSLNVYDVKKNIFLSYNASNSNLITDSIRYCSAICQIR